MSHSAQFRVVTSPVVSDDAEADASEASVASVVCAAASASDDAAVSDVPPHPAREVANMPAVNTAANTLFFILTLLLMKAPPSTAAPHAPCFPVGKSRCDKAAAAMAQMLDSVYRHPSFSGMKDFSTILSFLLLFVRKYVYFFEKPVLSYDSGPFNAAECTIFHGFRRLSVSGCGKCKRKCILMHHETFSL